MFKTRENLTGEEPFKVSLQYILDQYMYTNSLAAIFAYYKLTGIRVEIVPESRNSALSSVEEVNNDKWTIPYPMVFFSYRSGNDSLQTVAECRSNSQSIVLNPNHNILVHKQYFFLFQNFGSF